MPVMFRALPLPSDADAIFGVVPVSGFIPATVRKRIT